jgi:hypothetical protein
MLPPLSSEYSIPNGQKKNAYSPETHKASGHPRKESSLKVKARFSDMVSLTARHPNVGQRVLTKITPTGGALQGMETMYTGVSSAAERGNIFRMHRIVGTSCDSN